MGLLALSVVAFMLLGAACFGLDLGRWDNSFNGVLSFRCHDDSYAVTRVKSYHSNHYQDRRFDIYCSKIHSPCSHYHHTSCYWTGFINNYDAPIHYSCKANHYISGMYSVHNNHYQDRKWRLRCCQMSGVAMKACVHSGWTNYYNKRQNYGAPTGHVMTGIFSVHNSHYQTFYNNWQNYRAPTGHVMTGIFSVHNNHYQDRRYGYMVCKVGERSTEQPASLGVELQDKQQQQQQQQQQPASLMEYLGDQQSTEGESFPLEYLGDKPTNEEEASPMEYLGDKPSSEEEASPMEYLGERQSTEEDTSPLEYLAMQLEEQ